MPNDIMTTEDYCDLMRILLIREKQIYGNIKMFPDMASDTTNIDALVGIDQIIRDIQRKTHGQCTVMKAQRGELSINR